MKALFYWTSATLLVLTLLFTLFLTGEFIAAKHWPFHLIWGGFIATLGVMFVVLGMRVPLLLWGIREAPSELDPKALSRAVRVAVIFGLLIAVGGIAFALTRRVAVLIATFVAAGTVVSTALSPFQKGPGNDDS